MGRFMKAAQRTDGMQPLTRFKRVHVRGTLEPDVDAGIHPYENLTRVSPSHVRPAIEPTGYTPREAAAKAPTKQTPAADLHATDPIPLDILRKALPVRFAKLQSRKAAFPGQSVGV